MSDKPPFDPVKAAFLLALLFLLTACGDDNLAAHPPPVVINVPLKLGQEIVCVESRIRMGVPVVFPLLSYAKRTWTCDLRTRPLEHYT